MTDAKSAPTQRPFDPDGGLLLERSDSPWSPTMRLYRQPAPGRWDEVIARVVESLNSLSPADDRLPVA